MLSTSLMPPAARGVISFKEEVVQFKLMTHRDVVAHKVPITLLCVHLHREPPDIPQALWGALLMGHSAETSSHRHPPADLPHEVGHGHIRCIISHLRSQVAQSTISSTTSNAELGHQSTI